MKTLIRNGHVMDPANGVDEAKDILIEDGLIKEVLAPGQKVDDAEVIEADGLVVAPGFIDLHTHLREPGEEYKETIESGTQAAAKGGFTSICCMANTNPVNDNASVTDTIVRQAKDKGIVNVYPIGAITRGLQGKELALIGDLKKAGCVALSDDGMCVENSRLMRLAMEYAKNFDLPVITHSVDPCLSAGGVMNESFTSTKLGLTGIPNEAEDIMIARDMYLAQLTGAQLHIAHVATAGGAELIDRAKKKGLQISAEVTPHHFTLNDSAVIGYRTEAKMAPPLRSEEDRLALIAAMGEGVIDAIATDHAPHADINKDMEFDCASCGVIGMETAFGLGYRLVQDNQLTLTQLITMLTVKPAQIVHLNKGTLSQGVEADIVLLDTQKEYQVGPETFYSKSKNSPFIGMKLTGEITKTLVKGKIVYDNTSASYTR